MAVKTATTDYCSRLQTESANLVIVNAQQSDEGRYQCVARNIAGVRHSHTALLSVYGEYYLAFLLQFSD